ncbi:MULTISPECIES: hypothetical protein [unclassified Mesorhizobium]|uniref:hypothetical protein n=1 Tax=unclassified Mesorhizobium TaxID=325217 RepID=UPI001FEEBACE|nr:MULTISPECIES: hypothetical protein [unclassified Mesorhizobium]
MRALLIERNSQDLQALIEAVVTVDIEQSDDSSDHFFEVTMRDVSRHRYDILLNEKMIAEYLSQVAPVPFHPSFSFAPEIERHISDCGANITAVDLYIDDQQIFRPYRNEIGLPASDKSLRVQGIELLDFRDVDGGLAAVGWIGHHEYVRSIPSSLNIRGIRGRIGNVQIGDFDLFQDCYKEPRFNGWSIGELHIVDRRILPNARRDNLELNHHHYNLLAQMGPLAASISTKCRTSSVSRNAVIGIQNAIEGARRVLDGKPTIDAGLASSSMASLARVRLRLKGVGDETKRQGLQSEITKLEGELRAIDYNTPTRIVAFDEVIALVSKLVTNRDQAKKLKEALQNITA